MKTTFENPMIKPNQLKSILALLGAVTLGVVGMWLFGPKPDSKLPAQTPLIAIEKMGHLVSVKVNYADVIEFTERRTQDIPWSQWDLDLGGTKVLLIARGDCTIATNLGAAKYQNINAEKRTDIAQQFGIRAYPTIVWLDTKQTKPSQTEFSKALSDCSFRQVTRDSSRKTAYTTIKNPFSTDSQKIAAIISILELDK